MIDPLLPPPYQPRPEPVPLPGQSGRQIRVKLRENWFACKSAGAYLVDWVWGEYPEDAGTGTENTDLEVVCRDPCGIIKWLLGTLEDASSGEWYIPAGWYVTVWQPEDASDGHWEPLAVGEPCEGSGSGSGSEESGSEVSGSGSGCVSPGDKHLNGIPGYDAAKKQALIHNHGCLEWMDIEPCPEE